MEEQRISTVIPRQQELQGQLLVMWVSKTEGAVTCERKRQKRKICVPETCSYTAAFLTRLRKSAFSLNNDCKAKAGAEEHLPFCWGPWSNLTVIYTGFISRLGCNIIEYPCTKPSVWIKSSWLSLKGHVNQKRFLKTGRKWISLFKAVFLVLTDPL